MTVVGQIADGPLPAHIHVYVEQGSQVQGGPVDELGLTWRATLPSEGFSPGPALAFAVETRTQPFQATAWTEQVTIA